jgi:hypothetical protein
LLEAAAAGAAILLDLLLDLVADGRDVGNGEEQVGLGVAVVIDEGGLRRLVVVVLAAERRGAV